ncbi:MAG: CHAT domain-containing protein [Planctomycetes bacterium]|nr:CHAT domain-containing protein [Planctomycetota bacterium]
MLPASSSLLAAALATQAAPAVPAGSAQLELTAEVRAEFVLERPTADSAAEGERSCVWRAPLSGTAWIWCCSADTDPRLVVDVPGRPSATDDDGGDGTSALVRAEVEAGQLVAIRAQGRPGRCELLVAITHETEATRALRARLDEERAASPGAQPEGALEQAVWAAGGVRAILAADAGANSSLLAECLWTLAGEVYRAGDLQLALSAFEQVLAHRVRTLPPGHRDIQRALLSQAMVLHDLGEIERSVEIKQAAVDRLAVVLPADAPELARARSNLAAGLAELGRNEEALAIFRAVLESAAVHAPENRELRSGLRSNIAVLLLRQGDLAGAREAHETGLQQAESELGPESAELAGLRLNYALLCSRIGDCARARELLGASLRVLEARFDQRSMRLLSAQRLAAEVLRVCGDLPAARALAERALPGHRAVLGADSADVQRLTETLGTILAEEGRLLEARDLLEPLLALREQRLPAGSEDLESLRVNLSNVFGELGDGQRASLLLEQAIAGLSQVLSPSHPWLLLAQRNLAEERRRLGDFAGCLALQERLADLIDDASDPQGTARAELRIAMGATYFALGRLDLAEELSAEGLEILAEDPVRNALFLRIARSNLALARVSQGDLQGARRQLEAQLAALPSSSGELDLDALHTHLQLADLFARDGDVVALAGEARQILAGVERLAERSRSGLSVREADLLSRALRTPLQGLVTCTSTRPLPEFDLELVRLDQLLRELPLARAAALRESLAAGAGGDHAGRLEQLSTRITQLARQPDAGTELASAVGERARLERQVLSQAVPSAGSALPAFDLGCVRARLGLDGAGVAYVTTRDQLGQWPDGRQRSQHQLMAFVLRSDGPPGRVHLGPWGPIEAAIDAWRTAIVAAGPARGLAGTGGEPEDGPARAAGTRLRELVLDPLAEHLKGVRRLHVTLDGALSSVPLDALPEGAPESTSVVGDRLRIGWHETLFELCAPAPPADADGFLVAVGDVDYGATEFDADPGSTTWTARAAVAGPAFPALPATRVEVEALARAWPGSEEQVLTLTGARASEPLLRAAAPRARYLHLATHGWSAPEALARTADAAHLRDALVPRAEDSRDRTRIGLCPLTFSGLALAGIAAGEGGAGPRAGALDGEELASWDLSRCVLAVFSACETALGTYQTGRAADGLQRAARIAGVRQVLCSVWPVPDDATSELMRAFYAGLWQHGLAPDEALWRAKVALRARVDAAGVPIHGPHDWAGWVLWGPAP